MTSLQKLPDEGFRRKKIGLFGAGPPPQIFPAGKLTWWLFAVESQMYRMKMVICVYLIYLWQFPLELSELFQTHQADRRSLSLLGEMPE